MKKLLTIFIILATSGLINAQNVNIPDINFKANLIGNGLINTNGDSEIQVSEASEFTGTILCDNDSISDLTGIEAFTGLTQLNCNNNQLTSIDVSNNKALMEIRCEGNQITSLDASENKELTYLQCEYNQLMLLDVSDNTALAYLFCRNNQLTSLDLNNNTALVQLNCDANQLTSIDVSNNTALTNLGCANQLTSSQLTSLNVSSNIALNNLSCDGNQLKCLDVSKNSLLTGLDVSDNLLEILKTKNGAGIGMQVNLANNNLQCAEVDDISWAQNNWTYDSFTTFSSGCNYSDPCPNTLGLDLPSSKPKNLLRIYDVLGRETTFRFNTLLIYIYNDGSVEKVFAVE